jgi:hypothetical protein
VTGDGTVEGSVIPAVFSQKAAKPEVRNSIIIVYNTG